MLLEVAQSTWLDGDATYSREMTRLAHTQYELAKAEEWEWCAQSEITRCLANWPNPTKFKVKISSLEGDKFRFLVNFRERSFSRKRPL